MNIDFTLTAYRELLIAIKQSGYAFYTFEDWCDGNAHGRYVILRHDVDLKANNSLIIAGIEAEMGIRASYYFRIVPQSNQPDIIRSIAALGHEIGYHYEDLSLFQGDKGKAIEHFKVQLDYFRQFYPVRTVCMHGSPTSKWDNRDLWKSYNYRDYGITGEPYLDFLNNKPNEEPAMKYFTDTARMWDGGNYNLRDKQSGISEQLSTGNKDIPEGNRNQPALHQINASSLPHIHSTFDFMDWLKTEACPDIIMITTHPQRWTDKPVDWFLELLKQSIKNIIKRVIVRHS